jgi:hypothetical protein
MLLLLLLQLQLTAMPRRKCQQRGHLRLPPSWPRQIMLINPRTNSTATFRLLRLKLTQVR